jgi:hypothetical protein
MSKMQPKPHRGAGRSSDAVRRAHETFNATGKNRAQRRAGTPRRKAIVVREVTP